MVFKNSDIQTSRDPNCGLVVLSKISQVMTACDRCEQPRKAILEGGSCCYARHEMMCISNLSRKSNLSGESMRSLSKIMVINRPLDTATIVNAFMIREPFYFLPKQIDHQSHQLPGDGLLEYSAAERRCGYTQG